MALAQLSLKLRGKEHPGLQQPVPIRDNLTPNFYVDADRFLVSAYDFFHKTPCQGLLLLGHHSNGRENPLC